MELAISCVSAIARDSFTEVAPIEDSCQMPKPNVSQAASGDHFHNRHTLWLIRTLILLVRSLVTSSTVSD